MRLARAGLRRGRQVLSEDGTKAMIDSPENVAATKLMVDARQERRRSQGRHDVHGAGVRRAWETGKYDFMRNWPYAYALGQDSAEHQGQVRGRALPEWEGGGKAGILGGGNAVISVYSKNPGGALAVVDYLSSRSVRSRTRQVQPPRRR